MKILDKIKSNIKRLSKVRIQKTKLIMYGSPVLLTIITIAAVLWFFFSAPPKKLYMSTGPKGSIFERYAIKYEKILKKNGVKLILIPSEGSGENLKRLKDKSFKVDIAFVQAGLEKDEPSENLLSLGSVNYEPLYVFYRNAGPVEVLSEFAGRRICVGEPGSGTQDLSLLLLAENGIKPGGKTQLLYHDSEKAVEDILSGAVDVAFLMGDSVSRDKIKLLLKAPGIQLFDFTQGDAYTRRIKYLHKLTLPAGGIDFGRNIPPNDVTLIGPTIELVMRKQTHPAFVDLVLEAAMEVHQGAGMLKKRGEFPAIIEEDYTVSTDAKNYFANGQSWLYRTLPFWAANLINRIIMFFVPLLVIFPTILRGIPAMYGWTIEQRVRGWYRDLLDIERKLDSTDPIQRDQLLTELDEIEARVNKKVPTAFAQQFFELRSYIDFVRGRISPA